MYTACWVKPGLWTNSTCLQLHRISLPLSDPDISPFLFCAITAVLWCIGSHIYGVSEGQWRLLPGSARRICRQVNGKPCYLTGRETCVSALRWRDRTRRAGRPQRPDQSGWGKKSPEVHCPRWPSRFLAHLRTSLFFFIYNFFSSVFCWFFLSFFLLFSHLFPQFFCRFVIFLGGVSEVSFHFFFCIFFFLSVFHCQQWLV